jgi:hypothetical protein
MVARVRTDRTIVVAFSRHGEGPEAIVVPDGETAFAVAQQVPGKRAPALRAGDQLYVYHWATSMTSASYPRPAAVRITAEV